MFSTWGILSRITKDGHIDPDVWAIGDDANIKGQLLPAIAQIANQKGKYGLQLVQECITADWTAGRYIWIAHRWQSELNHAASLTSSAWLASYPPPISSRWAAHALFLVPVMVALSPRSLRVLQQSQIKPSVKSRNTAAATRTL
ncbi:hypothetical protein M405DRAFT_868550 [Rhizopogon salebrosus TDB-379]|nr:hypothetical protein M405DRAFT_868550 [Rhizopogon salebrosus TDB-379]